MCEVDQIPYPVSGNRSCDSLFMWCSAKYMFPLQPIVTAVDTSKIYNFCCSVLFHLAASPGMYYALIYFCTDLCVHKYSFKMS